MMEFMKAPTLSETYLSANSGSQQGSKERLNSKDSKFPSTNRKCKKNFIEEKLNQYFKEQTEKRLKKEQSQ